MVCVLFFFQSGQLCAQLPVPLLAVRLPSRRLLVCLRRPYLGFYYCRSSAFLLCLLRWAASLVGLHSIPCPIILSCHWTSLHLRSFKDFPQALVLFIFQKTVQNYNKFLIYANFFCDFFSFFCIFLYFLSFLNTKTSKRNIKKTPPFHNGGHFTLTPVL